MKTNPAKKENVMLNFTIIPSHLEAVAFAMSYEETRYYLNGVCFENYKDGTTGLIATDGHRLMSVNADRINIASESFILGSDDVKKAISMWKSEKKTNKYGNLQIQIENGEFLTISIIELIKDEPNRITSSFTCKPVDGNFPDWRYTIPSGDCEACEIGFNGLLLSSFAQAAKILSDQKAPAIALKNTGSSNPCIITIPSCKEFFGVLMPMRI